METMTQRRQRRRPPRHTDTVKATTGHQWRHTEATETVKAVAVVRLPCTYVRGTLELYVYVTRGQNLLNARKSWTDLGEMPNNGLSAISAKDRMSDQVKCKIGKFCSNAAY